MTLSGVLPWLFRSRETGRITLVQLPNWSLGLWIVATVVLRLAHPHGTVRTVLSVVAGVALAWWAVDEVLRGVNPFRRILGGVVLASLALSLLGAA